MGKLRHYTAYISVSCSGPEESTVFRGPIGEIRRRSGADLRYTTADSDWLYEHFRTPNYDTGPEDIHVRLVNPERQEFLRAVEDVSNQLNTFTCKDNWSGGSLTVVYAGHGKRRTGALVFKDAPLTGHELLKTVAKHASDDKHRRRLDLVLDSCFSGAFVSSVIAEAVNHRRNTVFPCSLFAAALHDEYAWEYPRYGHGIWTSAFQQQTKSPRLHGNRLWMLVRVLWRRFTKAEKKQLYNGGVAYMTSDKQHSMLYENGTFDLSGFGGFDLHDIAPVETSRIHRELEATRGKGRRT